VKTNLPSQIERWPLDRLVPYASNARTHSDEQIAQIVASIGEFGFTNPILVDTDAGILAGHARLTAARILQLPEVPVIVLDHLTEVQKRAYILADNKIALNATWDEDLLAQELAALEKAEFDLSLTGFSEEELLALLGRRSDRQG
jgi:ParB-like chromosome segregation protein Spo0J